MVEPRLIVVSGLPGVGKTEVASLVARALGAVHLSIDSVEEALLGAGLEPGWTTGVAAYEAVRATAETNLLIGRTVVVDAVNDSQPARDTWSRAAAATGAEVHWVLLTCSNRDEHEQRLARRDRGFSLVAEPTWSEVQRRAETYAPWHRPPLVVDSAGRSADAVAREVHGGST